jgi:hypothetical protein
MKKWLIYTFYFLLWLEEYENQTFYIKLYNGVENDQGFYEQ